MEAEGSWPHSQMPATCPYPETARSSPYPPHHTSWRSILTLSCHLRLVLPSCRFPSGLPTKTLYTSLLSLMCATCPARMILLDLITWTIFGKQQKSLSSSLCSFLHSPCYFVHLRPKYLPQRPILWHPQPKFLPQCERTSFNMNHNYEDILIFH